MKRIIVALVLSITSSAAFAQNAAPQPAYVPWAVSAQDDEAMKKFLADKPYVIAAPIMSWLVQREAEAVKAKAEADAKAADKAKSP